MRRLSRICDKSETLNCRVPAPEAARVHLIRQRSHWVTYIALCPLIHFAPSKDHTLSRPSRHIGRRYQSNPAMLGRLQHWQQHKCHSVLCRNHINSTCGPLHAHRRFSRHRCRAATADTETPEIDTTDAFAELVRMAVAKDPALAPLAEQHLKQRAEPAAPKPSASVMLGPSLSALPNSSKPPWLRQRAPQGERYGQLFEQMRELKLATVCEEAQCPNIGECWNGNMGEHMAVAM
eukprot:GHUV01024825.1.p1 GENE.GHUV01024825.1~~GHUV01024825.1.p1  ORF type:complete len:235 (-),score=18.12 GHUV01024825.1:78-782(-)